MLPSLWFRFNQPPHFSMLPYSMLVTFPLSCFQVRELDDECVRRFGKKLRFYFGANDHWCPVNYYHEMMEKIPNASAQLCKRWLTKCCRGYLKYRQSFRITQLTFKFMIVINYVTWSGDFKLKTKPGPFWEEGSADRIFYKLVNSLHQACTTYGPRAKCGPGKLLIWPANPQILIILLLSLVKTPFECIKPYHLWPLYMSKNFFGPP